MVQKKDKKFAKIHKKAALRQVLRQAQEPLRDHHRHTRGPLRGKMALSAPHDINLTYIRGRIASFAPHGIDMTTFKCRKDCFAPPSINPSEAKAEELKAAVQKLP